VRHLSELAKPQRQAALIGADEERETLAAEQQRRGMPAAEQLHRVAVRADFREDRGDELPLAQLAAQAGLDPGGDSEQAAFLVGRLSEHAQHGRRRCHRGQPLALDVPEDQPHAARGRHHLVQVPADPGPGGGRLVAHGQPDRADLSRDRPQQHALRHVSDHAGLGQFPVPASPATTGQDAGRRDARHGQEHCGQPPP